MIKFKTDDGTLEEDEAYMYSDKVSPVPLIKIEKSEMDKWRTMSDEDFYKNFCNPELSVFIEGNTEG